MSLPTTIHHFLRKNSNCSAHARCKTRSIDLNVLRLPHHNSSLPTLHPLRTTNIAGDSEIIALVKEEAQLDLEYLSVTTAAEEGQLPDFTEKDGLMWYTPDSETQPRLYVPEGQALTQLIKEAHDSPTGGHLGVHKTHKVCTAYFTGLKRSTRCMNTCAPACSASETNLQTNDQWACYNPCPFLTTVGSKSATIWSQGCQKHPVAMIP